MAKDKKVKDKKKVSAKEKQVDASVALKEAKTAYSDYLKKNKLSRDGDHSKDKKHGANVKTLLLAIEKASDTMDNKNVEAKKEKKEKKETKASGREEKYDYPAGLTPAEKKKFRIEARKANKPAKEGKAKDKKEKAKPSKEEKAPKGKAKKEETKAPVEKETVTTKKHGDKDKKKKKKKAGSKND